MTAQSQRPLMNKLLACDPLRLGEHTFTSIDDALRSIDVHHSVDELVEALGGHGIQLSVRQVYRWRNELT